MHLKKNYHLCYNKIISIRRLKKYQMTTKASLLLHICCAPCSPFAIELLQKDYDVTAFFYDPNIHPEEEYRFRLEEMKRFSNEISLPLVDAEYDVDRWFDKIEGHEMDKEKGERCNLCFDLRLDKTARFAKKNGFLFFATVLSTSPHKDAKMINKIGQILSKKHGIKFLEADFKKRDGFKKSIFMSKKYDLKRQNYCGCIYSQKTTAEKHEINR